MTRWICFVAATLGLFAAPPAAVAQPYDVILPRANRAWDFPDRNPAQSGLIVERLHRAKRNGGSGGGNGGGGGDGGLSLICGGGGDAAATGNATCIILNESTAAIKLGQQSDGNQTATAADNGDISNGGVNSLSNILSGLE